MQGRAGGPIIGPADGCSPGAFLTTPIMKTCPTRYSLQKKRTCSWGLAVALTFCAIGSSVEAALGAEPLAPPPGHRAEQLRFDPAQNRWVEAPKPIPGTEDGDLDIARQYLAREDYKTALRGLKAWMKTYGSTSPRYPEALYVKATAEMGVEDYLATLFRSFGGKCRSARESGFRVWGGVLLCGAGMVSAMPADHAKEPSYEINIGHFCGGFGLRSRAGRLLRHAARRA